MDHISGKGSIGSFVAFRTDIGMPSDGVQGGIIMMEAGDGFRAMALPAGDIGMGGMNIMGFTNMTRFTPSVIIEFYAPVGVSQKITIADGCSSGAVSKRCPINVAKFSYQGAFMTGHHFIFLIIARADFMLSVTVEIGCHLFALPQ
jgi:hypothetical protein